MIEYREYETYILIDFNKASKKVKEAFDDLNNLDIFFQTNSLEYNTRLRQRKSLISIKENVDGITLPSEERRMKMS